MPAKAQANIYVHATFCLHLIYFHLQAARGHGGPCGSAGEGGSQPEVAAAVAGGRLWVLQGPGVCSHLAPLQARLMGCMRVRRAKGGP